MLSKVQYKEEMPEIDLNKIIKFKTTLEQTKYLAPRSVGVKCKQSKHENEYLLIENTNSIIEDNQSLPLNIIIPFLTVTGLIIGAGMSVETEKRVRSMASHYEVSKASFSTKEYKIDIPGYCETLNKIQAKY